VLVSVDFHHIEHMQSAGDWRAVRLPLLLADADASVPLFDTTLIHAQSAVDWALMGPTV
jgi:aspartate/glutamate racemase